MLFRATQCLRYGTGGVGKKTAYYPYQQSSQKYFSPIFQGAMQIPVRSFASAEDAKGIDGSKDYYRILGISETATETQIKKSFYELAKKYHPDGASSQSSNQTRQEAETKFKAINEAYAIVGKKDRRSLYDDIRRATRMHNRGSQQADQTWSYTYDAKGNRRTKTYTTHQEDLRGHYSSKSYDKARTDYYGQNHGTNQDGSYRYKGGERYTANWEDWVNDQAQTSFQKEQQRKNQGSHRSTGSQFNPNSDPYAGRYTNKGYNMPKGMTNTRLVVLFGFVILIGGNIFSSSDIDLMDGAAMPSSAAQAPGGHYQMEMKVDKKTGNLKQVPVISEVARSQVGGLLKQDPEELRKQKQERQAEAKRIRRERRKLEKEKQDQLDELKGTKGAIKSISSEEYFTSVNDMIQQSQYEVVQSKKKKGGGSTMAVDSGDQSGSGDIVKENRREGGKAPPLVIIEQTPEGPKKHVFYGDVKMMAGEHGQVQDVNQLIRQEQEEIEQYLQSKKEKLRQLQMEKLKNTQQKIDMIDNHMQEELRSKKQRQEEQFRQQKRDSVEVRINPKLIGADIKFPSKSAGEFQHMQGGAFAK